MLTTGNLSIFFTRLFRQLPPGLEAYEECFDRTESFCYLQRWIPFVHIFIVSLQMKKPLVLPKVCELA